MMRPVTSWHEYIFANAEPVNEPTIKIINVPSARLAHAATAMGDRTAPPLLTPSPTKEIEIAAQVRLRDMLRI